MSADNRKQELRMDIIAGGFLLEKYHRDDADLAKICQRYAESISGTKSKK